jgi:hypothetical protein
MNQQYLDGLSDGFDAAITTLNKFSDSIFDTKTIYSQDIRGGFTEEKARLEFAMNTLQALREQLEEVSMDQLDIAAQPYHPHELELNNLTEDEWNEIDDAAQFQKALLTLISQYKSEGWVAVTLDKFARLVIGGHAGFIYGEESNEGHTL